MNLLMTLLKLMGDIKKKNLYLIAMDLKFSFQKWALLKIDFQLIFFISILHL
jgi:hypothetical protein